MQLMFTKSTAAHLVTIDFKAVVKVLIGGKGHGGPGAEPSTKSPHHRRNSNTILVQS